MRSEENVPHSSLLIYPGAQASPPAKKFARPYKLFNDNCLCGIRGYYNVNTLQRAI